MLPSRPRALPPIASPGRPVTKTVRCPDRLIRSNSGGWPLKNPSIEMVSEPSGLMVTFSGCWPAA